MKAKCISGSCGHEFENENGYIFYDTIDVGNVLFEIETETNGVRGYVFCPVCGARCIEVSK
jgi:hypothetical protein